MSSIKISADLRKQLTTVALPGSASAGKVLFHEGDPVRGAYLIRSGVVKLSLYGGSRLYRARILGAGGIVGLPATVLGKPYSLTAEVVDDCELYFIPRAKLLSLLRRNPQIGYEIVRILGKEIMLMRSAAQKIHKRNVPLLHPVANRS
jgi:CRP-like cAMP-binding protein